METADKIEKKLWLPSWKGVIITLLVGSNIILIRVIEALVFKGQSLENEISQGKELQMNSTQPSAGCFLCPNGWLRHRMSCYFFSSGKEYRTWNESQETCVRMGAHLLVIEDHEQEEFINNSSRHKSDEEFWIGLSRDGFGWRWVNGQRNNGNLFQLRSGRSLKNCVKMHVKTTYIKEFCQNKHSWICQMRVLKI
ncbi:natural killer cells antigen CD94-like [Pyxicephalus adspersus]|uniref:natural killer cells antigen CD94-like n=1 Tax=Pyxicephalus adspersus TaxID=30357 RepID=UPI003B58CF3D